MGPELGWLVKERPAPQEALSKAKGSLQLFWEGAPQSRLLGLSLALACPPCLLPPRGRVLAVCQASLISLNPCLGQDREGSK